MACHYYQLCAVSKAVIDDAIHGVQSLWVKNLTTENWGFLFVDEKNAFKNIHQVGMLWTVQHLWPSRARFCL